MARTFAFFSSRGKSSPRSDVVHGFSLLLLHRQTLISGESDGPGMFEGKVLVFLLQQLPANMVIIHAPHEAIAIQRGTEVAMSSDMTKIRNVGGY